jgi:hypothetical protein
MPETALRVGASVFRTMVWPCRGHTRSQRTPTCSPQAGIRISDRVGTRSEGAASPFKVASTWSRASLPIAVRVSMVAAPTGGEQEYVLKLQISRMQLRFSFETVAGRRPQPGHSRERESDPHRPPCRRAHLRPGLNNRARQTASEYARLGPFRNGRNRQSSRFDRYGNQRISGRCSPWCAVEALARQ